MPTSVRCDDCGKKFSIGDRELSGSCPACGTPKRKPKSASGDGKKKSKRATCPSCKTQLAENVSYCAKCGVDVGTADAAVAGMALDEYASKARNRAGWTLFWARLFRWW